MTEFHGPGDRAWPRRAPLRVAHLTTVDMSLALLLGAQLDAVVAAGGEAIGISAPGPFVAELERRGVRHVALPSSTRGWNPWSDLRAAGELWRMLRRERPTVLHTHNPKPGLYGRVVGRLAGVPIVVNTVHGLYATPDDPLARRAVVYALEAFASRWSDVELVQNVEDVEVMRRCHLVAARKVRHLGNGVDLERFRPGPLSAAERPSSARRGASTTTRSSSAPSADWSPRRATASCSSGRRPRPRHPPGRRRRPRRRTARRPRRRACCERATDAGVVLLGHRDDVDRLLGGFDLFVLASHREGQPRAAMEAAASGLPIVATDIRGCRQVVDDGTTGLLVPVADAAALRTAISALAASPERRRAMGAAARDKAEREFDEREVVRRVMDAYAVGGRRSGASRSP